MGFALFSDGKRSEGEAFYRRQIADPHSAFWQKARFYGWLGMGFLYFTGDYESAKLAFQKAWELDNGIKKRSESFAQLAEVACRKKQWTLADSLATAALQFDPEPNPAFALALSVKAEAAAHFGQTRMADSLFQLAIDFPGYSLLYEEMACFRYGIFLLSQNNHPEAEKIFAFCDRKGNGQGVLSCIGFALLAASRDESEKALDWLKLAFERHFADLRFLKTEPLFDKIRGTDQFRDLEKKYFPKK